MLCNKKADSVFSCSRLVAVIYFFLKPIKKLTTSVSVYLAWLHSTVPDSIVHGLAVTYKYGKNSWFPASLNLHLVEGLDIVSSKITRYNTQIKS